MKAVVLSRRNFREYDQIISFYTEEMGKQEALARGVKKIVSKNAAHLEPCFLVDMEIVPGKEINHVIKSIALDIFPAIRSDIKKSMIAQYIVSLVQKMTDVGQMDRRIYYLLLDALQHLSKHSASRIFIDAFVLRLFSLLGMQPELTRCVVCEKEEDITHFSFTGGGVLCRICVLTKGEEEQKYIDCSDTVRDGLIALLYGTLQGIDLYASEEKEYKKIHHVVRLFAVYQTDKKISDWVSFA